MRTLPLLSVSLLAVAALSMSSCRPSRVYADNRDHRPAPPPPPPARTYTSFSLIISPTPGFVMNRYPDGRFYHRNPAGLIYWKGYDNRFYLDGSYIHRVRYSQWEYNEWKRYSRGHSSNKYKNKHRRY